MSATPAKRIKLKFCGLQEWPRTDERNKFYVALWSVFEAVHNPQSVVCCVYGVGSTVTEVTLEQCGIFVPHPTGWKIGEEFDPNTAD